MGKTGRLKKENSRKIHDKLLELLERNAKILKDQPNALDQPERSGLLDVGKLLEEIRDSSWFIRGNLMLTRRSLHNVLKEYYKTGIIDKEKRAQNVYYYYKRDAKPLLFWKKTLEPFLQSMEISSGLTGFSSLILGVTEEPQCLFGIAAKAAILEAGIDVTSTTLMDDGPRDVLGDFVKAIGGRLREELKYRFGIDNNISHEKVRRLEDALEGRKLAIIYVLDGSGAGTARIPDFDEISQ